MLNGRIAPRTQKVVNHAEELFGKFLDISGLAKNDVPEKNSRKISRLSEETERYAVQSPVKKAIQVSVKDSDDVIKTGNTFNISNSQVVINNK